MMPLTHKPMSMGGCGSHHWGPPARECRRECKDLLVEAATKTAAPAPALGTQTIEGTLPGQYQTVDVAGTGQAIIGGGCCVQLSVEYMPADPVAAADPSTAPQCAVTVEVVDSEGCTLLWRKVFQEGYHVKDSIITTYPGARLTVRVANAVARVRWCEVFSC